MDRSQRSGSRNKDGFLTPANSLSGRYELLGRLGSGGMAEVFLARAVGLEDFEKIVVLKRVLPDRVDDKSYAAMFRDEARVAATLEHPNIVHTHDIGISDDECFFTMEYLHGEDLKAILRESARKNELLPLELAMQIAVGCAAGLHHAHEQTDYAGHPLHIVHRDVSPANIIVTRQSGVKLIDFGIAKAASDKAHTGVGVLKGKVAYMSPEQCRGQDLDRRSDIFALGIVLYEMITMQRPFLAANVLGTVHKVLAEDPAPPRGIRPECPAELERIVLRALHKDVDQRYQTAFEMQEELELATRDCQLLALPGGLGRYLEHLFGPKPHPWTERAKTPPAVPRWAWEDLDSTLTAPRQSEPPPKAPLPPPIPRPGPRAPSQSHTVVDSPPGPPGPTASASPPLPLPHANTVNANPLGSPGQTVAATAPVNPANLAIPLPRQLATSTAPTPAMPRPPQVPVHKSGPAAVSNALPTQAPYSRPQESGIAHPGYVDPNFMAMTSGYRAVPTQPWGLRHVLIGGLVGGIIAALGLWVWASL